VLHLREVGATPGLTQLLLLKRALKTKFFQVAEQFIRRRMKCQGMTLVVPKKALKTRGFNP
jgi:hypothetical protein